MIINSRILLLKLGLQINTANYLKDQRRPSISLASLCHALWDTLYLKTPFINVYNSESLIEYLNKSVTYNYHFPFYLVFSSC